MGAARYGVPINIIHNLSVRSLETFRPLSERWHQFLQLAPMRLPTRPANSTLHTTSTPTKRDAPDVLSVTSPRKRPSWRSLFDTVSQQAALTSPTTNITGPNLPVAPFSSPGTVTKIVTSNSVSQDDIKRAMRQLFRPRSVHFNSPEQEEGLHAVLRSETPLVVVLPTGGGKTLLAILPALLDLEGLTIVVVPFRALANDIV